MSPYNSVWIPTFFLAVFVAGCAVGLDGVLDEERGEGLKLAFTSLQGDRRLIYGVFSDGTGLRKIAGGKAKAIWPTWSPGGKSLAYLSNDDGNWEIYASSFRGRRKRRLTRTTERETAPAWSPVPSSWIAFISKTAGEDQVFLMRTDGTQRKQLTHSPGKKIAPAWSPIISGGPCGSENRPPMPPDDSNMGPLRFADANPHMPHTRRGQAKPDLRPAQPLAKPESCFGTQIAFESDATGNWEVYTVSLDGSEPLRLTHTQADNETPVWSPDGKKIAFESERDGNWEIYVMDADGLNVRRLTRTPGADTNPAWSPIISGGPCGSENRPPMPPDDSNMGPLRFADANPHMPHTRRGQAEPDPRPAQPLAKPDGCFETWLAFDTIEQGKGEIYIVRVDGTGLRNLTNHPADDIGPQWSPDGSLIAFSSNRNGRYQIYAMNPDGSDLRQLTDLKGNNKWPYWAPE